MPRLEARVGPAVFSDFVSGFKSGFWSAPTDTAGLREADRRPSTTGRFSLSEGFGLADCDFPRLLPKSLNGRGSPPLLFWLLWESCLLC